ncbi:MAG: methenyltetrahydromethanopterin cyclohydrolase [Candidatus Bathyarchaeia archaeon]
MFEFSINRRAVKLAKELCEKSDEYGVAVTENKLGTCIIDAGLKAKGGFLAGRKITEICLGGLGEVNVTYMHLNNICIPSISVFTDHPAVSTLGSQLAGWRIKIGDYSAVGSGPARALALKPKLIYDKIGYRDKSDGAVLVLETSKEPSTEVVTYISESCKVPPDRLFIILTSTSSVAGFTQIAGRIAETGIHKLDELGLDPKLVMSAWGCAPIMPVHQDNIEAMGRINDAILYGGVAYYVVSHEDDGALKNLVNQSVSSASKQYGRPFAEIFREAELDFYKIDPCIFAPAVVTINNARTGNTFTAGRINMEVLAKSMGLR